MSGVAGQDDGFETIEVPLYDVSVAWHAAQPWLHGLGSVCSSRGRACALRRMPVYVHPGSANHSYHVNPLLLMICTVQPWEDLPPLVAITKYCTSDNPLQRLSWAGVSMSCRRDLLGAHRNKCNCQRSGAARQRRQRRFKCATAAAAARDTTAVGCGRGGSTAPLARERWP